MKPKTPAFDFLIVGAGLWGATFARTTTDLGFKVAVVDQTNKFGGMCADYKHEDLWVNYYGPHVINTNYKEVWNWLQKFIEILPYRHRVVLTHRNKYFQFPFNLMTSSQIYGNLAKLYPKEVTIPTGSAKAWLVARLGRRAYEILYQGYTTKQWGKSPHLLPSSLVERIPIYQDFNPYYHKTTYSGMPKLGYSNLIEQLLTGVSKVLLATKFPQDTNNITYKTLVYTGPLDQLFDYCYGALDWRAINCIAEESEKGQGVAQLNSGNLSDPWTRTYDAREFYQNSHSPTTVLMKEYSSDFQPLANHNIFPAYPMFDATNQARQARYLEKAKTAGVLVGGRLGNYVYWNMDHTILNAIETAKHVKA